MPDSYRIFLSAVTGEFGRARDRIAADLRSRGLTVKVQSDFRAEAGSDTALALLHNYIRDCDAVVCVVGQRSGSCPRPAEAASFRNLLPKDINEASYTQWELFFARAHNRRLSVYFADDKYRPDRRKAPAGDRPALQQAYIRHIVDDLGLFRILIADGNQLRAEILREDWPNHAHGKLVILPYPSLGIRFKGRDEFLLRLRDSLAGGGRTAIVSQAVYGLGGIGKTRAAVEYAHAYADSYSAILFVIAATVEALRRNLAALAARLRLPEAAAAEEAVRVNAVIGWLNANPGWLLILDNLDSRAALQELTSLTAGLTGGHVLITSRLASFPGEVRRLQLDVLEIDDAAAFLLERTADGRRRAADDAAAARELAGALGGLALALEHAGAYIEARGVTLRAYLTLWRAGNEAVMAWCDRTVSHYERSTAATLQLSVAQLTEPARALLERLAYLAPEPIPETLLDVPIPGVEPGDMAAALADLAAYSLATRDREAPFFAVHRLVLELTRRSLPPEAKATRLGEALNWVNAAFAGVPDDVRTWPVLDPLAPHASAIAAHADNAGIANPTARLMNQLGMLLNAKARYAEAEPFYRRALAIDEKSFGPDHPVVATGLNNLAVLLRATNRLAEAEPLGRRALAIDEANFGPDHPDVATDLNNLALLLQDTNRLAEAEPLYRRALAIDETSLGPDHPGVAIDLNNLAALLQDTNRLGEAEPLYRRALAIDEASLGRDHPTIAARLNNLAGLLQATNHLTEAEPLFRRTLAIFEASLGPAHPAVATGLNNLAGLLQAAHRFAEAEPLYRRALAIGQASLGPDHPTVAIRLNNLARLLQDTNRLAEAEPLSRRQLQILIAFERQTGHPHPHRDGAIGNYAGILAAMGKSEAEIAAALGELGVGAA